MIGLITKKVWTELHPKTPKPFIFLISGTLPAKALLHRKQLSLFSMICRLPNNIMNRIACHYLLSLDCKKTWFGQLEAICFQYGLPHPIQLLDNLPGKEEFKQLVKIQITDYWQQHYRALCIPENLPSLEFFNPGFCPHPILSSAQNSFEVKKMMVQLRLLSG